MNTVEYYRNLQANRELTKLGLSNRIVRALRRVGVETYQQLLQVTVKELENNVPNIGLKSVKIILELVSSKGDKLVGQEKFKTKQHKQKRQWQGLTAEEFNFIYNQGKTLAETMEMVETKLQEKNR